MATTDDVINAIRNADAAGDSAAVRQLGAVLQQMQVATQRQARVNALKKSNPAEYDPDSAEYKARNDPTNGMSTTEKVLAGAGKAFADTGRGVGQLLRKVMPDKTADAIGLPTQADIDEAKRLDASLMNTTAGKVGNVGGSVAIALPTMFIPGAQTVAGSGLVGAGMGFIQPVASDESRLKNTVVGGALGAAAPIVARAVAAGYKGAKALVEPFTEGGRQAIAGRTLQRFGVEAGDLAGVSSNPTVTGARTTLAEQITRPEGAAGAARLQDAMRAADPEIAAKMAAREVENNAARVGMLREMAGEGGQREFYDASRKVAAKELYDKAFSVTAPVKKYTKQELQSVANEWIESGGADKAGLDALLRRATPLTKDTSVWRAESAAMGDKVANAGVGDTISLKPGPVSTSADYASLHKGVLVPAADAGITPKIVEIRLPAGKPYGVKIAHSDVAHPENIQNEFLLGSGIKFKVVGQTPTHTVLEALTPAAETVSKITPSMRREIVELLRMPAIKDAMKGAQEIAQNQGTNIGNKATGSIEGLHNMKLALDDQIANLSNGTVSQVNKAKAIEAARDRLVTFMERVSPGYGEARATYAAMSKPINQMDVAEQLFRKGTSATSDLGGTPRLMPNQFIGQLKNEEALVKSATGRDLGKLSQVLDPEQFAKVQALGMELDKSAAVGRAANGPGSATAQRLASQNVLRQLLGPTGLPETWAESTLLNTAMRPVQFAYNGVAEPKIQAVLADLLMNPAKAQAAIQAARTAPQRLSPELRAALPYLEQALKTSVPAAALSGQR